LGAIVLSALRDVRIWVFMGLGVVLSSAMWAMLGLFVAGTLSTREADLSKLTPEQRMQAELETVDRLGREVLGVEGGIPVAELTEEHRLMMEGVEVEDFELVGEGPIGLVPKIEVPVQQRIGEVSAPPSGFQRASAPPTPISPLFASLGCGAVIVMFGMLGTALLFWPRGEPT
jgi:hypothetical protein